MGLGFKGLGFRVWIYKGSGIWAKRRGLGFGVKASTGLRSLRRRT